MTDEQKPGFNIQGAFYAWVRFDDWLLPDCRLARLVTGFTETQLLRGEASDLLVRVAFAAVAFRHASPGLSVEDAARVFDGIKPDEIEAAGFKPVEADAGPPDESGSTPSENGEPSSAATPETSPPNSSTDPAGPTISDTAEKT